jgi:ABC-type lipoprotein release transport system permease subunit
MYLTLAWRNIWRNKRRTVITAASIFTAVVLALVMRSSQLGSYQRMVDNVVSFYSGHIEIHQKGYWEEQTLDNSFVPNDTINTIIENQDKVAHWVPRLESFTLASSKDLTKGSMLIGIDPIAENKLTHLADKIVSGKYLGQKDVSVLVSEGLASYLQLQVKDTLIVLGQGYHGVTAAGKYGIQGIVKFPTPEFNEGMIYMTLTEAQKLYGTGRRLTSIAISIQHNSDAPLIANSIQHKIRALPFEVLDWKQMMPEMVQLIEVDNAGGIITIATLYMIIAFGILGTILMMLTERKHEFGILVAIGMSKQLLALVVVMEILMIAGLGVLAGTIAGIPIITYFNIHPIKVSGEMATTYERFGIEPVFPFSNDISIYYSQAIVVFLMTAIIAIYPWVQLLKMKTINALKS